MEDLSLHILDVVENSTRAGATLVEIKITEDKGKDFLQIVIKDNGSGMDQEMVETEFIGDLECFLEVIKAVVFVPR